MIIPDLSRKWEMSASSAQIMKKSTRSGYKCGHIVCFGFAGKSSGFALFAGGFGVWAGWLQ
jgi:hypothetical protein